MTGPGPGPVFGPHVRAFDFDGSVIAAKQKISFFAYGTPRYGVNVSADDVNGDGAADVTTGPGPSPPAPHPRLRRDERRSGSHSRTVGLPSIRAPA
ncbi:MAG: hypothetical protein U0166_09595 [Acidobacteriota bacterium]